jgi:hypothetical protein
MNLARFSQPGYVKPDFPCRVATIELRGLHFKRH